MIVLVFALNLLSLVVGQSPAVPASCSNGIAQLIDECPQIDQLNQLAADLLSRSIVEEKEFPSGCCRVISDLNAGRCFCDEEIVSQFREVIDDEFLPSLLFQASQVEPAGCSVRIMASVDQGICGPFGNQIFPQDLAEVEEECTGSNLISDVLAQSDDNQFLVEAIDLLGLESQLDVLPTVTLLAPTDKAFNDWAAAEGIAATELFADEDFLVRILARHIVANATIEAENIQDPERFKALQGSFLNVIVNDDALLVQGFPVQMPSLQACNGLIYKIDTVLWPDNKTASNADILAATGQIVPSVPISSPPKFSLIPPPSLAQAPPPPLPQTILPPLTLPPIVETIQENTTITTTTTTTATNTTAAASIQIKEEITLSPLVMTLPQIPAFQVEPQPVPSPDMEMEAVTPAAPVIPASIEPVAEQYVFQANATAESFMYADQTTETSFQEADGGTVPAVVSPAVELPQAEEKVSSQQDLVPVLENKPSTPLVEVTQENVPYDPTATGPSAPTTVTEEKPCTINVYQLTTQFLPLFSNYLEYAELQGLKDILEKSTDITVIIPINTAFSGITEEELAATWNPLNHIVMQQLSLQELSEVTEPLETLAGFIDVSQSPSGKVAFGDISAGGTEVVQSDVVGCNGRLQVVGQLILNSEVTPIGSGATFNTPAISSDDQQFVDQIQSITTVGTPTSNSTTTAPTPTSPMSPPLSTSPPPPAQPLQQSPPPPSPLSFPPPPLPTPTSTLYDPTAPSSVLPDIVSSTTTQSAVASATAVATIPSAPATTPTFTRPPFPTPAPTSLPVTAPATQVMALPTQPYPALAPATPYTMPQVSVMPPIPETMIAPLLEELLVSTQNPAALYEYYSPQIVVNSTPTDFVQTEPAPINDFSNRQNFYTPAASQQGVVANVPYQAQYQPIPTSTPTPPPTPPAPTPTPTQSYYTPVEPAMVGQTYETPSLIQSYNNPVNPVVDGQTYEQGQGLYSTIQATPEAQSPPVISELQTRVTTGSAMSAAVSEVDMYQGGQATSPAYYVQTQSIDAGNTPYGIIDNQESEPPCACTQDGMSGGVNTTLLGCAVFVEGWPSFCYVVNPYGCFLSKPSQKYAGARWRNCTVVEEDVGSNQVTQLEVLQQVAESTNQSPQAVGGYSTPVETTAPSPQNSANTGPCSCSPTGTSGGVQTGRPGCVEHVPGYSPFCYVLDPLNCFVSRASTRYPSAGWRYCAVPSNGNQGAPSEMQNVVRVTILPVYDPLTGSSRYGMFLTPKDNARKL